MNACFGVVKERMGCMPAKSDGEEPHQRHTMVDMLVAREQRQSRALAVGLADTSSTTWVEHEHNYDMDEVVKRESSNQMVLRVRHDHHHHEFEIKVDAWMLVGVSLALAIEAERVERATFAGETMDLLSTWVDHGVDEDGLIMVYSAPLKLKRDESCTFNHWQPSARIRCAVPDGSGQMVAVFESNLSDYARKLVVLDETGRERFSFAGHSGQIQQVIKLKDSPVFQFASCALNDSTVRVWFDPEVMATTPDHPGNIIDLGMPTDNATGLTHANTQGQPRAFCNTIVQLSQPSWLACGCADGVIRVADINTSQVVRILPGHCSGVTAMCLRSDGHLVAGSADGTLHVYDMEAGSRVRVLTGHKASITAVAALPYGGIASGSSDGTSRIWRATGECTQTLPAPNNTESSRETEGYSTSAERPVVEHSVAALLYLEGRLVTAHVHGEVAVWNLRSGTVVHKIPCADDQREVRGGDTLRELCDVTALLPTSEASFCVVGVEEVPRHRLSGHGTRISSPSMQAWRFCTKDDQEEETNARIPAAAAEQAWTRYVDEVEHSDWYDGGGYESDYGGYSGGSDYGDSYGYHGTESDLFGY